MIIAAQRDDSHQSNCNLLNSVVNVVTRDLFENELFALQVMGQLQQQNTWVLVELQNTNTGQNWERLSEKSLVSHISKVLVCLKHILSFQ